MKYGIIQNSEHTGAGERPWLVIDSTARSMNAGMLGPNFTRSQAWAIAWMLSALDSGLHVFAAEGSFNSFSPRDGD